MKKAMILCLLLVLVCGSMWAQQGKYYSDSRNSYKGFAEATYLKTDTSISLDKVVKDWLKEMKQYKLSPGKMTKEQEWLFWQALNEYNYKDGELYMITIVPTTGFSLKLKGFCVISQIRNGKVQMSEIYHSDILDAEVWQKSLW